MTAPRAAGFAYRVVAEDGHARAGVLTTPHAVVETPTFMPVTCAAHGACAGGPPAGGSLPNGTVPMPTSVMPFTIR